MGSLSLCFALLFATSAGAVVIWDNGPINGTIGSFDITNSQETVFDSFAISWQKRYYDRNVRDHEEFIENLKYIHRNPVKRKLAEKPEDWERSSFRHYAGGEYCGVEIESWRNRTAALDPIIAN